MEMVSDQLIVGLADKDIQGEILAKGNQLPTFEEKLDLVQALEDGKRTKVQLGGESTIAAQSTYRKFHKTPIPSNSSTPRQNQTPAGCSGCGSKEHGKGTGLPRHLHCPARNAVCDHCQIKGHMSSVCRKRNSQHAGSQATSKVSAMESSWFMAMHQAETVTQGCQDDYTYS